MKKNMALLLSVFISFSALAGGGWVHKKGKGYFKLGQNMIRAGYYFGPNGDLVKVDQTISLYTTSIYGEYGLSDRWNIELYMPFFVRSTINNLQTNQSNTFTPGDAINSFGDTDLSVKYGFFQDKAVVMAAKLTLGFPFGHSDITSENILQTGDGEFNQMISVHASHSFYPAPVYASAYAGFNNRTKGFSDEIRFGGEVGAVLDQLVLSLKLNIVESLYNGDDSDDEFFGNGSNLFSNNVEYFSFTPEVSYFLNDTFGVTANTGFAFSGRRILAAPNFGVGVFLKL